MPWSEARAAGALLGTKTVINELVAYLDLSRMSDLSERSRLLMTYALCGFANLGSLGIMIGGLGTMCPERRAEIVALGIKSIVGGHAGHLPDRGERRADPVVTLLQQDHEFWDSRRRGRALAWPANEA